MTAATFDDVFERVVTLQRERVPFALATVVRSRKPASGRPGDRAVVLQDGSMHGWIGGSCAQPTIRREALRALADGKPRLVRLRPEGVDVDHGPRDDDEGVVGSGSERRHTFGPAGGEQDVAGHRGAPRRRRDVRPLILVLPHPAMHGAILARSVYFGNAADATPIIDA